jgi:hypothetical protein
VDLIEIIIEEIIIITINRTAVGTTIIKIGIIIAVIIATIDMAMPRDLELNE